MSGTTPEQEPSIEEILASIRQIISDDDEGAPAAPVAPEPVPEPEPEPEPVAPPPPKEDILVLKDPLPTERPVIDMVEEAPIEEEEEEEEVVLPPEPVDLGDNSIFTETVKAAAISGFSRLAHNVPVERGNTPRLSAGATLEDIVRDMLQPMLRDWLDENLPPIIEKLVQKELDKLSRQAMDE